MVAAGGMYVCIYVYMYVCIVVHFLDFKAKIYLYDDLDVSYTTAPCRFNGTVSQYYSTVEQVSSLIAVLSSHPATSSAAAALVVCMVWYCMVWYCMVWFGIVWYY